MIFIDEIDSLLTARSENENESSRRIKTEFLVQLDGAHSNGEEKLLVIGATNRPQELDEAAKRRFVKRLYIPLPNAEAREELIKTIITNEQAKGNVIALNQTDIDQLVQLTKGYSGADMKNLCAEASMMPIRSCMEDISKVQIENIRATES